MSPQPAEPELAVVAVHPPVRAGLRRPGPSASEIRRALVGAGLLFALALGAFARAYVQRVGRVEAAERPPAGTSLR